MFEGMLGRKIDMIRLVMVVIELQIREWVWKEFPFEQSSRSGSDDFDSSYYHVKLEERSVHT
jgi:hypothetical protein